MGWIGEAVTVGGVGCIVLPILAGISRLVGGPGLSIALTYAPTFVIGGILLFVIGTIIRLYTSL